ncbi:MBL fold metallo-hydrolase [Oceanobacillus sp. CAU 1775]
MLFQKEVSIHEHNNVRYIEGTVAFNKVKLNTISYEVDGVLIDTGAKSLIKEFTPFFKEMDVDQVVITHHHEDHTGAAAFLQKEYNLPVYTHPMMQKYNIEKASYPFYRKIFWGNREPFEGKTIGKTFKSRNATWDVIETPGHAKDHLAFLNQQTGQLFSGDLFVTPKTKLILRNESIPTIIHSIEHTLTYDFEEMFCCHAGYVRDGKKALMAKLEYLKELQGEVLFLNNQGYHAKEIQKKVFGKKYPITFFSLGEWDSLHIIQSIIDEG